MEPTDTGAGAGQGAQRLCINVQTNLPLTQVGSYVVAGIECQAISRDAAYLILEPDKDRVTLTAACGCHVYVPLTAWLADLFKLVRESHQGSGCPVPVAAAQPQPQPQPQQEAADAAALAHLHSHLH